MNAAKTAKLLSSIQVLVSSVLALFIAGGLYLAYRAGSGNILSYIQNIFPEIAIIFGTLTPALILRIKHRSQVPEGYLLPLFLLLLSLQTTRIMPEIFQYTNISLISLPRLEAGEHFFFMASYVVLLFAATQNMKNINTSKTGGYVVISLISVLIIASIIPSNSNPDIKNVHDSVFNMLVFLILAAAVLTYLVSFIADKETYHLKRFLTFLFLSAGDYLIMTFDGDTAVSLTGTLFFLTGAVMLSAVSPKGY